MIETRPVHRQLLEQCQRELASGRWEVGARYSSERELVSHYGVSRATANKVLAKLTSEGWLEMRRGLGMYVAERPTLFASLQRMESFTEFASAQGFEPGTEVLVFRRRAAAPKGILEHVPPKAGPWIYLERLRLADGEAVIYERRWLPEVRFPGLAAEMLSGSFFGLCRERYGLRTVSEEAELRAVDAPEAGRLDWKVPALRLRGAAYGEGGDLLWVQELFYRGDRFTLFNFAGQSSAPELRLRMTPDTFSNINTNTNPKTK